MLADGHQALRVSSSRKQDTDDVVRVARYPVAGGCAEPKIAEARRRLQVQQHDLTTTLKGGCETFSAAGPTVARELHSLDMLSGDRLSLPRVGGEKCPDVRRPRVGKFEASIPVPTGASPTCSGQHT